MKIREAGTDDLIDLSKLFDGYRQFYGQPSNEAEAREFLGERLARKDSVILIAVEEGATVGFVQLYPSYSSVAMKRIFILNDLFVVPGARNCGVATALLKRAESFATEAGAVRLTLATEIANRSAQSLYGKLGWQRDEEFCHFAKSLGA